jgi:hypothetical protein
MILSAATPSPRSSCHFRRGDLHCTTLPRNVGPTPPDRPSKASAAEIPGQPPSHPTRNGSFRCPSRVDPPLSPLQLTPSPARPPASPPYPTRNGSFRCPSRVDPPLSRLQLTPSPARQPALPHTPRGPGRLSLSVLFPPDSGAAQRGAGRLLIKANCYLPLASNAKPLFLHASQRIYTSQNAAALLSSTSQIAEGPGNRRDPSFSVRNWRDQWTPPGRPRRRRPRRSCGTSCGPRCAVASAREAARRGRGGGGGARPRASSATTRSATRSTSTRATTTTRTRTPPRSSGTGTSTRASRPRRPPLPRLGPSGNTPRPSPRT